MHSIIHSITEFLIAFINQIGYLGIFVGMFLESTLVPLPSELIMIPAGMSAAHGGMNLFIALACGISGNILGAVFSYYLAASIGRTLLFRLGKYFFVKPATIIKIENFFNNHGPISIFIGRLLPGFRHFISLPAGIANMNLRLFFTYTTLGSTIWTSVLIILGFLIGENQQLIEEHLREIVIICIAFCVAIVAIYIFRKPARK